MGWPSRSLSDDACDFARRLLRELRLDVSCSININCLQQLRSTHVARKELAYTEKVS